MMMSNWEVQVDTQNFDSFLRPEPDPKYDFDWEYDSLFH